MFTLLHTYIIYTRKAVKKCFFTTPNRETLLEY